MNVTLTRKIKGKATIGEVLVFDGIRIAGMFVSLELPDKENKKGISCIPPGEYTCKWTYSPTFKRDTYEVLNVPDRSGIRFHPANYIKELKGCISLGESAKDINKDGVIDITNSKKSIEKFETILNKKQFKLKII